MVKKIRLDYSRPSSFLPLFNKINRFAFQAIFRQIGNRTNAAKMPIRLQFSQQISLSQARVKIEICT